MHSLPSSQLATAIWIIDKLALRVGNDKDEDEADTVGCCSLRVEHLSFKDPYWLTMDFLAKDSMRYHQEIRVCFLIVLLLLPSQTSQILYCYDHD